MSLYAVLVVCGAFLLLSSCKGPVQAEEPDEAQRYAKQRHQMVQTQILHRGIRTPCVLAAMEKVPRHRFIPVELRDEAYDDHPVPIGQDQTISQPYIVAFMTEAIDPQPADRVLEIGTGSGYQAAVLAEIVDQVYTMEIVPELGQRAASLLDLLGYANVHVQVGDGYAGWPDKAPFDKIVLTAAPPEVPQPLLDQLREGGVLIAPVGVFFQELMLYRKTAEGLTREAVLPVRFVPMTGKAQE